MKLSTMCKVNSTLCRTSVGTNVCVFPMVLFLIWLLYHILICSFLIYLIVFYLIITLYMLLHFLMRVRKGVDVDGRGSGQEPGGVRDKENHNQNIL